MVGTNGVNGTNGHAAAGTSASNGIDANKFKKLFFTPIVPFLPDDTIDYDGYRSFIRRFSQ